MQRSFPGGSPPNHQYEELVSEAIAYIKGGQLLRARRLLERATLVAAGDAQVWLWLSATTDDLNEQRSFLERAVAADPSNAAARRGLVMLSEKMKKEKVFAEGEEVRPLQPHEAQPSQAQAYRCPQCGGSLRFDLAQQEMKCANCGYVQVTEKQAGAERLEQPVDFVMPTERGHRWAEAQQQVSCEQCGALSLLPPGQTADHCPYCGSNRMVRPAQQADLVDPQAIGLIEIDEGDALQRVKSWLGKGWFAPDDLRARSGGLQLRAAYYPFWTFDGMIEVSWTAEVNEGTSRNPHWVSRSGVEMEFFDEVIVPGLRKMSMAELAEIEPFNVKELVEFKPEYLAGWSALTYDYPLADASLLGREKVIKRLRQNLYFKIEPGKEKRNINSGGGKWSGLTFKNIYLPLWTGTYRFQGKEYRVLVNGQTGKVGGGKPRDNLKVALITISAAVTLMILLYVAYVLLVQFGLLRSGRIP